MRYLMGILFGVLIMAGTWALYQLMCTGDPRWLGSVILGYGMPAAVTFVWRS